jgi:hypothetical protein
VVATTIVGCSDVLQVAGLAPLLKDQNLRTLREQRARLVSQGLLSKRCCTVVVVVEIDKDDAVVAEQIAAAAAAAAALERDAVVGPGHWVLEYSKGGH